MMRFLTYISALLLSSAWSASGKAIFFTQSELIRKAEVIAIIVLEEPVVAKPIEGVGDPFATDIATGERCTYSQQANARVEKVIKGTIPDEFTLYGKEGFICAQCELTKGRFLAFLSKDGVLWAGTNWQRSLRPIRNKDVEWFVPDGGWPMKYQKLVDVVAQIEAVMKKQQSEAASADQPATKPAGEGPAEVKPSTPTSKDGPQ